MLQGEAPLVPAVLTGRDNDREMSMRPERGDPDTSCDL